MDKLKVLIAYIPIIGILYIFHTNKNAEKSLLNNWFIYYTTAIIHGVSVAVLLSLVIRLIFIKS